MIISKLNLTNFRNYSKLNIGLSPHMNIFIGNNAAGKTNILEAISILALTKSYRNGQESNLIQDQKKKAKIKGTIKDHHQYKELAIEIAENEKQVKVNGKIIHRIADYIKNFHVIVFTPDDLEIIKGSPSVRRNLLNMELSQISQKYLVTSNEYNKILKTRNEYLKILFSNHIADKTYLDILTDQLIEKAIYIYQEREKYLDKIEKNLNSIFLNITKEGTLQLKYVPNIEIESFETEKLREQLKKSFKKNYQRELHVGMTLIGPHRDDFLFFLQKKDMKIYASQGQQKSAILAYKLATIPIFKEYSNTSPVLLLDDIFSELDLKKRNRVLKYIGKDIQSIITTTDLKNISKKVLLEATIFSVKNGNVERNETNGRKSRNKI